LRYRYDQQYLYNASNTGYSQFCSTPYGRTLKNATLSVTAL